MPKERHIAPGEAIVLEATHYLVYAGEDAPAEFSPARQPGRRWPSIPVTRNRREDDQL